MHLAGEPDARVHQGTNCCATCGATARAASRRTLDSHAVRLRPKLRAAGHGALGRERLGRRLPARARRPARRRRTERGVKRAPPLRRRRPLRPRRAARAAHAAAPPHPARPRRRAAAAPERARAGRGAERAPADGAPARRSAPRSIGARLRRVPEDQRAHARAPRAARAAAAAITPTASCRCAGYADVGITSIRPTSRLCRHWLRSRRWPPVRAERNRHVKSVGVAPRVSALP